MAYTALYRKFRPPVFDQIIGQEHITKTLKNQIKSGRVGHAYLFNGGRGTGKTSAAKILARAVNCLNPQEGEPCNECEICKAAISGSLTDIVEMDAASNNSVEDIRLIRDEVNFLPTTAKYRVYIIDEVHMLSTGAFNALLKTLEEPPEHVKFILATTEPQKLPATILSRCQRFDFKKISDNNIAKWLAYVCKESNVNITEDALKTIASLAEGAMRDALSILDRCIQEGSNQIDVQKIKDLVGIPQTEYIYKVVEAILNKKMDQSIDAIDEIIKDGKDINNLVWEIIKYVKDILLFKTSKKVDLYTEEELKQISILSESTSKEALLKIIFDLSELENNLKWATQKSIILQVGIMKLCSNEEINDKEELIRKINKLEKQINEIEKGVIHNPSKNVDNTMVKTSNLGNVASKNLSSTKAEKKTNNMDKLKKMDAWPNIVNNLKQDGKIMLYTNLINTNARELNDMMVGIEFPNGLTSFGKAILEKPENMLELTKAVSMEYGKDMVVKLIDENNLPKFVKNNEIDDITKNIDMKVNIIED